MTPDTRPDDMGFCGSDGPEVGRVGSAETGSHPADQARSGLGASRFDPARELHRLHNWLDANDRVRRHPKAAEVIAARYGRDWKTGRNTAVCAASFNTPTWQAAVARCYPTAPCLFDRDRDGSEGIAQERGA